MTVFGYTITRMIIGAAAFVVALLVLLLLVWPMYREFSLVQQTIRNKNIELENNQRYFSELARATRELDEYADRVEKARASLPEDLNVPLLFDLVQDVVQRAGLILNNISAGNPERLEESNIFETSLSIQVEGQYHTVKNFIEEVRSSAQLLEIQSLSFGSPSADGFYSVSLELTTYSY